MRTHTHTHTQSNTHSWKISRDKPAEPGQVWTVHLIHSAECSRSNDSSFAQLRLLDQAELGQVGLGVGGGHRLHTATTALVTPHPQHNTKCNYKNNKIIIIIMMMMMMMMITTIIIIIIIIIILKHAIQDFLLYPHCASNCFKRAL